MTFGAFADAAFACPSTATLNVTAMNYNGPIEVQLREGSRPGSRLVETRRLRGSGVELFPAVCPGRYFFAFGTPDSDVIKVTSYFNVENDGYSFSNPTITVYYQRTRRRGGRHGDVGAVSRRAL